MKKKKRVCISGGFDPLHIGHIRYIQEAAKLGYLIVIVNRDDFLLKKKGYVFMPLDERIEVIKSIKGVDEVFVCIDNDQTVCKSLRLLKPDIFAKGGDRTLDNIPEKKICEELDIEMKFMIGGGKIQSSSDLVKGMKKPRREK